MFLKRRNTIAWVLILLSAVLWSLGQAINQNILFLSPTTEPSTAATTYPIAEPTTFPTTELSTEPAQGEHIPTTNTIADPTGDTQTGEDNDMRFQRFWMISLCAAGVVLGIVAVFVLRQKTPLLGPDGTALLLIPLFLLRLEVYTAIEFLLFHTVTAAIILVACRELWGWVCNRLRLDWCISRRIANVMPGSQFTLLLQAGWVCVCAVAAVYTICRYYYVIHPAVWLLPTVSGCFGILCLWKYGEDLGHFKKQLNNYQQGLPITVKDGAFAQTEAQLLEVQAQHEEAVRTAVTSERFKVELISNVSHDLRTPLTAILGYSELLQKEALSPEGQEQLRRLHLKAGYMNDLVESLFELTKVSSGVIEAKKEEIDLVRLLEQTIGLFDDQLTDAGLLVRRHYESGTIPIITDGARMHQVFANLLGNAIKYALAGTRIYLEVKETRNSYRIRMMNTSSYEMDFQAEEIMQRFVRGDKARSTKGSGLGLAIAQTYTESVGGTFRVAVDGDQFSAIVELPKN